MTDKELLERAAKAAGLIVGRWRDLPRPCMTLQDATGNTTNWGWNPLTDDGDALRLAVACGICLGQNLDNDTAVAFGIDGRNITEPYGANPPIAATRRAIVRAAAEMGQR